MCVDWSELSGDSSEGLGLAADGQAEGGRRVGSGREKLLLCWRIRWSVPVLRAKEAEVPKKPESFSPVGRISLLACSL